VPAIAFERVSFAHPGHPPVLAEVDLAIEAGGVVALVGRSGAGKSTLLRLVNRLALPDAGHVRVEGRDTRDWDPIALRRRTGYVLQEVGLFPHLTIGENITLIARVEGWAAARIADRLSALLSLVDLPESLASRWPDQLSGGQRQRVGVARALMLDPPLLLMDEPFGALDPLTRLELHRQFREIQARVRKTVLLVTHDLREAQAMADRIGVLDEGRLASIGTLPELMTSEHPFTRRLLETLDSPSPQPSPRTRGEGVEEKDSPRHGE
jgi:osmoprotectant transport system ATP-binding protein